MPDGSTRLRQVIVKASSIALTALMVLVAQPSISAEEKVSALGMQFDNFASITAGWWIEKRCNHLTLPTSAAFEWRVNQIKEQLAVGKAGEIVPMAYQLGKAQADQLKCGVDAEFYLDSATTKAKELHKELAPDNYSDLTSLVTFFYDEQTLIAQAIGSFRHCDFQGNNQQQLEKDLDSVTRSFEKFTGSKEIVSRLDKAREKAATNTELVCNSEFKQQVSSVLERLAVHRWIFK
jgi:hypothetical protein